MANPYDPGLNISMLSKADRNTFFPIHRTAPCQIGILQGILPTYAFRSRFCYRFEPSLNEWKEVPPLTNARTGFSAVVAEKSGKAFVTGGFGFYNLPLDSFEILEKAKEKWDSGSKVSSV